MAYPGPIDPQQSQPWDASTSVTPPSGQQTSPTGVPFATPQSVGAVPSPPSVADSMTPPPNQPGPLKSLLTRFAYGAGQALLAQSGLPTDFEIQRQNFNQQIQQQEQTLRQQQQSLAEQNQQYQHSLIPVTTPGGYTIFVPPGAVGKVGAAGIAAQGGIDKQDVANQGKMDVANIQYGANLPLDPTVAQLAGIPGMAGKPVGKAMLGVINQQLQARGIKTQDLGSEGTFMIDRAGNRLARLGESPSVARGYAFAQARAQYTPFETVDANGAPTTISNLQAIQQGAPGIGKPNLVQSMGKAALLGDIRGGIQQVKGLTSVLDDAGTRATVAAVLADPGGTPTKFIQSGVAGSLSPQAQDYVINLMNLREQTMAMRSVLGAGQGSQDLRDAIQRTIPGASTPGSEYANRQLDTFSKTLDRLEKGIPNLGAATQGALGKGDKGGIQITRDANGRITGVK